MHRHPVGVVAFLELDVLLEAPGVFDYDFVAEGVGVVDTKAVFTHSLSLAITEILDDNLAIGVHHSVVYLFVLVRVSFCHLPGRVVELPRRFAENFTIFSDC